MWPQQSRHHTIGHAIGRVSDALQQLVAPHGADLQRHNGNDGQVDEPHQTGGAQMQQEVKFLRGVLVLHCVAQLVKEPHHEGGAVN